MEKSAPNLAPAFAPTAALSPEQQEIARLTKRLAEVERQNQRQRQALRDRMEAQRAAHIAARTDPLTNLSNTRRLSEVIEQAAHDIRLPRNRRIASGEHALILIDLDGFKAINDTHGHLAGNAALKHAAQALVHIMRGKDEVTRIGGDEFAILMHDTTREGAVKKVHEIETMFDTLGFTYIPPENAKSSVYMRIGGSAGMSMMDPNLSIDEIKARADAQLYASKARRKASGLSPAPEAFA